DARLLTQPLKLGRDAPPEIREFWEHAAAQARRSILRRRADVGIAHPNVSGLRHRFVYRKLRDQGFHTGVIMSCEISCMSVSSWHTGRPLSSPQLLTRVSRKNVGL